MKNGNRVYLSIGSNIGDKSLSLASSLLNKNFKIALIKNKFSKIYLVAVSKFKLVDFKKYCKKDQQKIIIWINEKNF